MRIWSPYWYRSFEREVEGVDMVVLSGAEAS